MNKIITCEECGIDYYSETIVPRQSFRHVFPDIVKLEAELADKEKRLAEARAEIERLKGVVISQITPEPFTPSSYSTSTEPTKDERDKLIEQMRDALKLVLEGAIHDFHYVCQHQDNCLCWGCQKKRIKAVLSTAERISK